MRGGLLPVRIEHLPVDGQRLPRDFPQPFRRLHARQRGLHQPAAGEIVDEHAIERRTVPRTVDQPQRVGPGAAAKRIPPAAGTGEFLGGRRHGIAIPSLESRLPNPQRFMSELILQVEAAARDGKLLPDAARNISGMLAGPRNALYLASIAELVDGGQWAELNDRFYKTLAFGTGGLRGRTIGKIVTEAEQGEIQALGRPQYPCVGTNAMNSYNISRATQGLVRYVKKFGAQKGLTQKPKIVIAYDTRHFSRDFAELTAKVATENGCDVDLFESPRSTPELSFAVRLTHAQAGIVLTASHNPPHDNGYKVYFDEGAQIVEPHASGIIAEVNSVEGESYEPLHGDARGELTILGAEIDAAYLERLKTLVLDPAMLEHARDLRIVYTPIHGTGGVVVKPALEAFRLTYTTVPEQDIMDGRFPTVKSPNPENAEALSMGMALAGEEGADLVIATDPGCRPHGSGRARQRGRAEPAHRQPDRLADRMVPAAHALQGRDSQ